MSTKDELAAMIEALESQPHLSIKEEKYLAIMKELFDFRCHQDDSVQVKGLIAALDNESLLCRRWESRARLLGWVDY